jgi:hypothetical protein
MKVLNVLYLVQACNHSDRVIEYDDSFSLTQFLLSYDIVLEVQQVSIAEAKIMRTKAVQNQAQSVLHSASVHQAAFCCMSLLKSRVLKQDMNSLVSDVKKYLNLYQLVLRDLNPPLLGPYFNSSVLALVVNTCAD